MSEWLPHSIVFYLPRRTYGPPCHEQFYTVVRGNTIVTRSHWWLRGPNKTRCTYGRVSSSQETATGVTWQERVNPLRFPMHHSPDGGPVNVDSVLVLLRTSVNVVL